MAHYPEFATFSKLASSADYVPVYRRILSDVLTPVSAFHKIDDGGCACLFESVIGGEKVGRYSFLAVEPFKLVEARGNSLTVEDLGNMDAVEQADGTATCTRVSLISKCESTDAARNALTLFRDLVKEIRVAKLPELPPFVGGAVGYAGYDTVRYVEKLPKSPEDDRK